MIVRPESTPAVAALDRQMFKWARRTTGTVLTPVLTAK
jgi:hypothetical protein